MCGVANNPSILFIEEPVQGVDPASEKEIWSLIRTVSKNKTVVIASHPCPALEFLCTRIAVVSKGRIVQIGTPQQFRGSAKGTYVIRIELEKNTKALLTALTKHKAKIINGKCVATTKQPMQVIKVVNAVIKKKKDVLVSAEIRLPGIQDVLEAII